MPNDHVEVAKDYAFHRTRRLAALH